MKKYLLSLLLMICALPLFAQSEVVELKNGSVIKCTILEQTPGESIKIKTSDGSIYVYKQSEVAKISKLDAQKSESSSEVKRVWRPKGYRGFFDFSAGPEVIEGGTMVAIKTTHGFQINPRLFVGAGLGVIPYIPTDDDYYSYYDEDVYIPFYTDVRFSFLKSRITPYIDAKIGCAFQTGSGVAQFYFNPSIGCHFSFVPRFSMNVGLGFELMNYTYETRYSDYDESEPIGSLMFNIGLEW